MTEEIATAKQKILAIYPHADIHAHGRDIWLRSIGWQQHRANNYEGEVKVISKTFRYEGSWDAVKDPAVWDETCIPVWEDAASRLEAKGDD